MQCIYAYLYRRELVRFSKQKLHKGGGCPWSGTSWKHFLLLALLRTATDIHVNVGHVSATVGEDGRKYNLWCATPTPNNALENGRSSHMATGRAPNAKLARKKTGMMITYPADTSTKLGHPSKLGYIPNPCPNLVRRFPRLLRTQRASIWRTSTAKTYPTGSLELTSTCSPKGLKHVQGY